MLWPLAIAFALITLNVAFMFASLIFWMLPGNWREAIYAWFRMIQVQAQLMSALIIGEEEDRAAAYKHFLGGI